MWLRRGFFGWLIPAAFVLPLWLLIGWAVTGAGGWAFLWVLFMAIPGVLVWQLLLTLLNRARATVRAHRAVSWWDVAGFATWHALVASLGFFGTAWWAPVLVLALIVGVALFWLQLWQLWREARPSLSLRRFRADVGSIPAPGEPSASAPSEVFVVTEATRRRP